MHSRLPDSSKMKHFSTKVELLLQGLVSEGQPATDGFQVDRAGADCMLGGTGNGFGLGFGSGLGLRRFGSGGLESGSGSAWGKKGGFGFGFSVVLVFLGLGFK